MAARSSDDETTGSGRPVEESTSGSDSDSDIGSRAVTIGVEVSAAAAPPSPAVARLAPSALAVLPVPHGERLFVGINCVHSWHRAGRPVPAPPTPRGIAGRQTSVKDFLLMRATKTATVLATLPGAVEAAAASVTAAADVMIDCPLRREMDSMVAARAASMLVMEATMPPKPAETGHSRKRNIAIDKRTWATANLFRKCRQYGPHWQMMTGDRRNLKCSVCNVEIVGEFSVFANVPRLACICVFVRRRSVRFLFVSLLFVS